MSGPDDIGGVDSHATGLPEDVACRVCVASNEIAGAARNGGIGTAYTSLVHALAEAGHQVTVLFLGEAGDGGVSGLVARYADLGIDLVVVAVAGGDHRETSLAAYRWLREAPPFHVVHFPECCGLAFHTVAAKRCGLAFRQTTLCVGTHSSTEWIYHANEAPLESPDTLADAHMERAAVAGCDVLLSPSRYLVEWMREAGWHFPATVLVQPYVQPAFAIPAPPAEPIRELVFFGRLETRKGLEIFCDAIDALLAGDGDNGGAAMAGGALGQVTFLGRDGRAGEFAALEYLERRREGWPGSVAVEMLTDLDQQGALRYLAGGGRLAVMASPVDNSPNTVYECLGLGVPFLAARTGGIPELIAAEDAERATFAPDPESLRAALSGVLGEVSTPVRPAVEAKDNREATCRWHARMAGISHPMADAVPAANPDDYTLIVRPRTTLVEGAEALLRDAARASGADIVSGLQVDQPVAIGTNAALALLADPAEPADALLIRREIAPPEAGEDPHLLLRLVLAGHRHQVVPEITVEKSARPAERSTYARLQGVADVVRQSLPEHAGALPMLAGALSRQAAWLRSEVAGLRGHIDAREEARKTEKAELKAEIKQLKGELKGSQESSKSQRTESSGGFLGKLGKRLGGDDA